MNNGSLEQRLAQDLVSLNNDMPIMQIVRMLKRYNQSILPVALQGNTTFTVASATSANIQISIDSSYSFICIGLTCVQTAINLNTLLATLQLNSGYNLLNQPMLLTPVINCTQGPFPWNMYVPYNSQINFTITNGSTTAANTVYLNFIGFKVPKNVIDAITGNQNGS
jgi:hypothetical protein